jgi:hypothetical protein
MVKPLLRSICLVLAAVALVALALPLFPLRTFARQANCQSFPETGKQVCGKFLDYWVEHGGLSQYGYPISQEMSEVSELNGRSYTVQYFERSVFEYHPENQPPNDVLLAQLGTMQYKRKYGAPTPAPTLPAPPPAPTQPPAAPATPAPPPPTASPEVAPPTTWINYKEYAQRNGITFVVYKADIARNRIDVYYLIENETTVPISMNLANADQLIADNDYNNYPPADPNGVARITIQPNTNYSGMTSFTGSAYYNRAKFLTYGINNIPNLGNVRVRIPMP